MWCCAGYSVTVTPGADSGHAIEHPFGEKSNVKCPKHSFLVNCQIYRRIQSVLSLSFLILRSHLSHATPIIGRIWSSASDSESEAWMGLDWREVPSCYSGMRHKAGWGTPQHTSVAYVWDPPHTQCVCNNTPQEDTCRHETQHTVCDPQHQDDARNTQMQIWDAPPQQVVQCIHNQYNTPRHRNKHT